MRRTLHRLMVFAGAACALTLFTSPAWCQGEDNLRALEVNVKKAGFIQAVVNADGKVSIDPKLPCAKVDQVVSIIAVKLNITDEDMEAIATFPHLRLLDLQGTQVTDKGLGCLKGTKTLRRLALRGTQVTDATLEHVQGLTELEMLSVGYTGVTDEGLAFIARMNGLRVLDLEKTAVTDKGLQRLSGMKNLAVVYLGQTRVTQQGVAALARALPETKILWQSAQGQKPQQLVQKESAEQRRKRLQTERTAVERGIAEAEAQIGSCLENTARCDAEARECLNATPPRFTSATALQATARQFRTIAQQFRSDIRQYRERIRAIDKALNDTAQEGPQQRRTPTIEKSQKPKHSPKLDKALNLADRTGNGQWTVGGQTLTFSYEFQAGGRLIYRSASGENITGSWRQDGNQVTVQVGMSTESGTLEGKRLVLKVNNGGRESVATVTFED